MIYNKTASLRCIKYECVAISCTHAHTIVHWHVRSTQSGSASLACVGFVVFITECFLLFWFWLRWKLVAYVQNVEKYYDSNLTLLASHAFFLSYAKIINLVFQFWFWFCVRVCFGKSYRESYCIGDCVSLSYNTFILPNEYSKIEKWKMWLLHQVQSIFCCFSSIVTASVQYFWISEYTDVPAHIHELSEFIVVELAHIM